MNTQTQLNKSFFNRGFVMRNKGTTVMKIFWISFVSNYKRRNKPYAFDSYTWKVGSSCLIYKLYLLATQKFYIQRKLK